MRTCVYCTVSPSFCPPCMCVYACVCVCVCGAAHWQTQKTKAGARKRMGSVGQVCEQVCEQVLRRRCLGLPCVLHTHMKTDLLLWQKRPTGGGGGGRGRPRGGGGEEEEEEEEALETRWLGVRKTCGMGLFYRNYRPLLQETGWLVSDFISVCLETRWLGQKKWFLCPGTTLYVFSTLGIFPQFTSDILFLMIPKFTLWNNHSIRSFF